ncbi:hypothetical protein DEO72_LG10g1910 [Vigna unguiculata]|uniref:Uncharacterized protein n=1 Tax=Vigna unguiculata TaxID=3917 RepID=A0A4D6NDQ8_VIGUN|nr:hypothetical protein DEO72_LG10g1910 [Vigna unguiculata]
MSSGDPPRPPPVDKGKGLHTLVVPPFRIPSSSFSTPHTGLHTPSTDIGASPSPHIVPSPASIGGPSSTVGQQLAPSPVAGSSSAATAIATTTATTTTAKPYSTKP